ncbi:Na+/H+ antiporter subunit D [Nostoc sp. 3335mG]|nr:Na+/H+ antiporter subunit D [Nostoc sp. 3335mG]
MAETTALGLPPAMIETATAAADWVVVLPVVLGLLGSAALLTVRGRGYLPVFGATLVTIAIIACEIGLLLRVSSDGPLSMTMGRWLPPFGISFTVDLFSAAFALAASIVTLVVIVYAELDRGESDAREGFHSLVLLLLAGVTGSFLTGDLFNLYVWFEVTLIASFGLIVLGTSPMQLDGAVKYGFLNFLATTLFLLSLGLTYGALGTLNMADIIGVAPQANRAAITGIAALLLLAFGMKAAAFPLNAWLPAAYHTPSPAVSALFAGLLTKVGAYALLRTLVALLPDSRDVLEPLLAVLAILTLVIAPLGAIAETQLRRAIGFFVIGGIGSVLAGLALPDVIGVAGAGLYIFHAILTMTALYMVVGLVETRTGATDTRAMGGLYAHSAPLAVLFFVLVLAAAGVPPFLGFWPKLLLLEAGTMEAAGGWIGPTLVAALVLNAILTLIAGTRLWAHVFWRNGPERGDEAATLVAPTQRSRLAFGAAATLVLAVVALGLWPNPLIEGGQLAAGDLLDTSRYVKAVGLAGDVP